jgi:type I restriction enzyme, R subunit
MKSNQIQAVIHAFRISLPEMLPGCTKVPKTLILANNDVHADAIVKAALKEFGESSNFIQKVTYKATEHPQATLVDFCNFNPRIIVVTVELN